MNASSSGPIAEAPQASRRMRRSGIAFLVVLGLLLVAGLALLVGLSTGSSGWLLPEFGGSVYVTAIAVLCVPPVLIYSFVTGVSVARSRPVVLFWLIPEGLFLLLIVLAIAVAVAT